MIQEIQDPVFVNVLWLGGFGIGFGGNGGRTMVLTCNDMSSTLIYGGIYEKIYIIYFYYSNDSDCFMQQY